MVVDIDWEAVDPWVNAQRATPTINSRPKTPVTPDRTGTPGVTRSAASRTGGSTPTTYTTPGAQAAQDANNIGWTWNNLNWWPEGQEPTWGIGNDYSSLSYFDKLWYFDPDNKDYYSPRAEFLRQYNSMYQQAKDSNEARYSQLLGLGDDRIASAQGGMTGYMNPTDASSFENRLATVDSLSNQLETDAKQQYKNLGAQVGQGLVNTGMANTTVAPTMQAGVQRGLSDELARIGDQKAQLKLGVQEGQASTNTGYAQMYNNMLNQAMQNKYATIENRSDSYPDQGMYYDMLFNAGASDKVKVPSSDSLWNTFGDLLGL